MYFKLISIGYRNLLNINVKINISLASTYKLHLAVIVAMQGYGVHLFRRESTGSKIGGPGVH